MRDVVVIGGSAGAIEPLRTMLRDLPASTAASIFVAIHTSPDQPGMLAGVLASCTAMPVAYAADGQSIVRGQILLAPRDHHLLLGRGRVSVTRGPRENGFRPAVDPLFRSAAKVFGARVVGVILSGGLDDGTRGLAAVKAAGGLAVVQQPDEVFAAGMPASAIRHVAVDHIVPAAELGRLVHRLVHESPLTAEDATMHEDTPEPDAAERGLHALETKTFPGSPSTFTCPECGGTLWELANGTLTRFACHVGHSYSPDTLATSMAATLEAALWTALRTLEEHAAFLRRMQERAARQHLETIAEGYGAKALDVEARAAIVRTALVEDVVPSADEVAPAATAPRPTETS